MRRRIATLPLLGAGAAIVLVVAVGVLPFTRPSFADPGLFPTASQLRALLVAAPSAGGEAGGLFHGSRMWAAIVDRNGKLVVSTTSTADPTQVWPGSEAIAKSKAYTANAFSLDTLALSTAQLYTFTQPGHSLSSLGQSNLFDPRFLAPPSGQDGGKDHITGGLITFGGGVPLYRAGKVVGGLGAIQFK